MRIAFHAPLKAPDHPVPSGDRQMARLLIAALQAGDHTLEVVSTFRSFLATPDPGRMREIETAARHEITRITARWEAEVAPDLWFTYHPYYKAPDLIGPALARWFGLPYATAEASHAGKRATGPWADWHGLNEAAIRDAALHVCFTPRDADGLASLTAPDRILLLPPFIAPVAFGASCRAPHTTASVRLVTVAMMRPGDKARSYAFLAAALKALPARPDWHLTIIGDGPGRPAVALLFGGFPAERITWAGECDATTVAKVLANSDLYVWPGFGEAYGIAYLEAAAVGLPVLAMACGGIASVVSQGETGLLTPEGDLAAYTAALAGLMADAGWRGRLGLAGRRMVLGERTVAHAARRLNAALHGIIPGVAT